MNLVLTIGDKGNATVADSEDLDADEKFFGKTARFEQASGAQLRKESIRCFKFDEYNAVPLADATGNLPNGSNGYA